MIEDSDYVSYEVADELNTAGFSETSLGKYVDCPIDPTLFHGMFYEMWNLEDGEMLAPSLWQAAKWLRGRGYIISVEPSFSKHSDNISYIGRLYSVAERGEIYSCSGDCGYEKAFNLCMKRALQLLNE